MPQPDDDMLGVHTGAEATTPAMWFATFARELDVQVATMRALAAARSGGLNSRVGRKMMLSKALKESDI